MSFGELVKNKRINLGLSLRAFCVKHHYDPGNHSRLERGILNPPDDEAFMTKLALALGIAKGSVEWFDFYSLASIARQEIPKELLDDDEVVDKLPVLFRTLQGEPLPANKMDDLINFIRRHQ
jgi:transcriptional regulator with XRE-family HTH domain